MRHLVVVPHTHWDREWHHSFEAFRHRLVGLVDGLLDLLEGDPAFRHFTLDGQAIVVDDYLEVRPSQRERIAKLVRDGRLLVGPWYVLPDEWLVSGEALIRNLRLGLSRARALGAAMELGYVPDQFGHVGQLPQLFAGFGFPAAALWRGVGADVDETLFEWEAPDGTRLPTVYLPFGYGNAERLPLEPGALAARLERIATRLARHSRVPTLLLMNGADHQAPQPGLPRALEAAGARLTDASVEIGTLPGFWERARSEASGPLPRHRGELRSGLRAPLLPGCASARMEQKRRDFALDRELTRYLEPLAAWLSAHGGDPGTDAIDHAWRQVLRNHPHDSICGCSIDAVHDEVDARLARAEAWVAAHRARVAADLARLVAAPPPAATAGLGEPGEALVVWNPNAAGRAGVDGELELDLPLRGRRVAPFHLRDARGRSLPARADLLDAGADRFDWVLPASLRDVVLRLMEGEIGGAFVRGVRLRRRGRRAVVDLRLGRHPEPFDVEPARRRLGAWLREGRVDAVRLRARTVPRVRLRFADELPGWGVSAYRVAPGEAPGAAGVRSGHRADGGAWIGNAHWRVEVAIDGRVDLHHLGLGCEVRDALRIVSEGDRGDEYNFDPVPGGEVVDRPQRVRVALDPAAGGEASVRIAARFRVPRGLVAGRDRRRRERAVLPVRLGLRLREGLDTLELEVELDNTARDHRLRLQVSAPFPARRFEVESAFEIAERPIEPGPDDFGPHPAERPIGATPQRGFATLEGETLGLSVANRGGGEVEALADDGHGRGALAVTLLRAVGWLSRGDLALRPMDAGPRLETPGAQVPGVHRLAFGLRLHAADEAARVAAAHRFAHPPLPIRRGESAAEATPLRDGDRLVRLDDPGVSISALEPRAEGGSRLRLVEIGGADRELRLRFGVPALRAVRVVDLAGRGLDSPAVHWDGSELRLVLPAHRIVTLQLD